MFYVWGLVHLDLFESVLLTKNAYILTNKSNIIWYHVNCNVVKYYLNSKKKNYIDLIDCIFTS